jgi:hypothetical protein
MVLGIDYRVRVRGVCVYIGYITLTSTLSPLLIALVTKSNIGAANATYVCVCVYLVVFIGILVYNKWF